jgi:nucleotide sugar dehydrogenase
MAPKIGFIGQGWIGKNYADNFHERGYEVIRYSQEDPYIQNKEKIKDCDFVFIAVPTPTTPDGFDDSILQEVLANVGEGKVAIIKSTIIPGTTEKMQKIYPKIIVLHSPEFLTEKTAKYDASNPDRNIVGYADKKGEEAAHQVIDLLPPAPYRAVVPAKVAELVKYAGNCWFFFKVIFINMLYDLSQNLGVNYEMVKRAMGFDPRIGFTHLDPVHQSGRGAGGHCFIKDFAAFSRLYQEIVGDKTGNNILTDLEKKNIELLVSTGKDLELLAGVYGKKVIDQNEK